MGKNKNKVVVEGQEGEIDPAEAQGAPAEVASKVVTNTETAEEAAEGTKATKAGKGSKDQVVIRYPGNVPNGPTGGSHRVFSKTEHGDDFKAHAEANRKRFNGEYVDALPGPKTCPTCGRAN